jgi:hypothetical protein
VPPGSVAEIFTVSEAVGGGFVLIVNDVVLVPAAIVAVDPSGKNAVLGSLEFSENTSGLVALDGIVNVPTDVPELPPVTVEGASDNVNVTPSTARLAEKLIGVLVESTPRVAVIVSTSETPITPVLIVNGALVSPAGTITVETVFPFAKVDAQGPDGFVLLTAVKLIVTPPAGAELAIVTVP